MWAAGLRLAGYRDQSRQVLLQEVNNGGLPLLYRFFLMLVTTALESQRPVMLFCKVRTARWPCDAAYCSPWPTVANRMPAAGQRSGASQLYRPSAVSEPVWGTARALCVIRCRSPCSVFRCLCPQAGKDRTGLVSAMVLHCAGASREGILDDYVKWVPCLIQHAYSAAQVPALSHPPSLSSAPGLSVDWWLRAVYVLVCVSVCLTVCVCVCVSTQV